jgi:hypothetical protein
MTFNDFKLGIEFRYRDQTWRCTDVGARVIVAICLTETWAIRVAANTGMKERVRFTSVDPKRLEGPPYGVPEEVLDERKFALCIPLVDWQAAKRLLGQFP